MVAKYTIISIIISIVAALICSCSDRSVVHDDPLNSGDANTRLYGAMRTSHSAGHETIYCIAIDQTGDVLWLEIGDSIDELGFPLTEQQMEMWKTYALAVIDIRDLDVNADQPAITGDTITDADMIILAAGDLPVDWSCLKYCQGASNYASCVLACMGKRPVISGP